MQLVFENVNGNYDVYMDCLIAICGDANGKSMIDLGCNKAPYTHSLGFEKRCYIDIIDRVLDNEQEQQFFVKENMLRYLRDCERCDVTISSDSIEHLNVMDAITLITLMEYKSDRQVIFTPLNEWMMDENGTDPEGHHSLWTPEHLPDYASIVFPQYHPSLNIGAWFGWRCENLEQDFERVKNILNQKSWATK